jgi:hypothetical protein
VLRQLMASTWLITEDFNMIYHAEDKNNNRLDRKLMGKFRHWPSMAALKEIHLNKRLFTWSNERSHLTLERIDRAFISNGWEDLFPNHDLHSLASVCSDHAPLLLQMDGSFMHKRRFHFKSFWPRFPGFAETMSRAWRCPLHDANPFQCLDWLFRNTAGAWTNCSARSIGSVWV